MENLISFTAGAFYGFTSVMVGQPLDTVKTRLQAMPTNRPVGFVSVATNLYRNEGVKGLYRGGAPLFVGGALIRSAQFGFYENTIKLLRPTGTAAPERIFGFLDWHVVTAGFVGGVGRGIVESPFEFVKVRRQVDRPWSLRNVYKGSSVTIFRNSFLFSFFVIYIDFSKQIVQGGLSPFLTGAICANLAWLTVWPLDVIKSQKQSGNYQGMSSIALLKDLIKTRKLYRGVVPGVSSTCDELVSHLTCLQQLARSTIANGCSMTVYEYVKKQLTLKLEQDSEER